MRSRTLPLLCLLGLTGWLGGCGDLLGTNGRDAPSALVAVSPARGESRVSVLTSVTLQFSQPVDSASVAQGVALLDGRRPLWTRVSSSDDRTFVLTPSDPLDFGTTYTIEVSRTVSYTGGEAFPREESWQFATEGAPAPEPSTDYLEQIVRVLAHDSMQGRGSGTPYERKAAEYVARLFDEYGLTELPGGFFQEFSAASTHTGDLVTSQNVLGVVGGHGVLGDEWIVVGAHYDHIGFRNLPDESQGPNNGADDNASGTALLLELARQYADWVASGGPANEDRRSVLFIAFGAEEEGLLGSCFYARVEPVVPISRTVAMLNLDMVGRLRDSQLEIRLRPPSTDWQHLIINANEPELALDITDTGSGGVSDYSCFGKEGVPYLGLFTGFHPQYHKPGDDAELINFPGMRRVGGIGVRVLHRLVVMTDVPASS